jgi:hypothetical protein
MRSLKLDNLNGNWNAQQLLVKFFNNKFHESLSISSQAVSPVLKDGLSQHNWHCAGLQTHLKVRELVFYLIRNESSNMGVEHLGIQVRWPTSLVVKYCWIKSQWFIRWITGFNIKDTRFCYIFVALFWNIWTDSMYVFWEDKIKCMYMA